MRFLGLIFLMAGVASANPNQLTSPYSVRLQPKIHTETPVSPLSPQTPQQTKAIIKAFGEGRLLGSEGSLLWLRFEENAPPTGIYTAAYAFTNAALGDTPLPTAEAKIEILHQNVMNQLTPVRVLRAPRELRLNEALQVYLPTADF